MQGTPLTVMPSDSFRLQLTHLSGVVRVSLNKKPEQDYLLYIIESENKYKHPHKCSIEQLSLGRQILLLSFLLHILSIK